MKAHSTDCLLAKTAQLLNKIQKSGQWNGAFYSNYLVFLFNHLSELERAKRLYYSHDKASLDVFYWRQEYLILSSVFPKGSWPVSIDFVPFTQEEWHALEEKAKTLSASDISASYLLDIIDTWLLEAYALPGICEAQAGDIVLDCGAYTGNTSIYFSQKIGATGHVYGFEPSEDIFTRYAAHVANYDNITPFHTAVSNVTGHISFSADNAPDSHITDAGKKVPSIAIDDFVTNTNLPKVNFIKMDIEGAEEAALNGARNTIKKYRPHMAISIYHKNEDIYTLPALIHSIYPGYTFYLRHYSNEIYETVLYCQPSDTCPETLVQNNVPEEYTELYAAISMFSKAVTVFDTWQCNYLLKKKDDDFIELQKKHIETLDTLKKYMETNALLKKKLLKLHTR